jgi:hypothetical protein
MATVARTTAVIGDKAVAWRAEFIGDMTAGSGEREGEGTMLARGGVDEFQAQRKVR